MQNVPSVVRLYHTILSHLNYGILVVSADERISFVNQRFCEQLGLTWPSEQFIGLSVGEALARILPCYEDPPEALRLIREMVSGGGPVLGVETRLKNGRAILVDFVPIVVDGETGWLVPVGDEAGLSASLRSALGDAARRQAFGAAGRARVLARFSAEEHARRTGAVYAEVLAGAGG